MNGHVGLERTCNIYQAYILSRSLFRRDPLLLFGGSEIRWEEPEVKRRARGAAWNVEGKFGNLICRILARKQKRRPKKN